jgi:hypothetical protein
MADMVSMAGRVQRDAMNGDIISQSLGALNSVNIGGFGNRSSVGVSNNADYAFQTSVLNAAYSGKGAFVDIMI